MITSPLAKGNGYRHGWIGSSGKGKTYASRALIESPGGLTLIHDTSKAEPEFPGVRYFPTTAAALAQPVADVMDLSAIGFRGDAFAGVTCDVEDVAALALIAARRKLPTRLVIDELNCAVSESGQRLTSDSLREALTAGRTMGLSIVWSTQIPQRVPGVVFDLCTTIGIFWVGAKSLNYLDERLLLDPDMIDAIAGLDVGEFVLHRDGGVPWDRTIYRVR